jgi:Zn-dependent protease with chaperone function
MATVCAAYVLTVIVAVVLAIRIVSMGSGHSIAVHESLGPVRLALIAIAALGAIAAVIAAVVSGSLAARAARIAGAREAAPGEAEHARTYVDDFALALGFGAPTVRIVDDDAPNAFAAGRGRACVVCVTTGALSLPPDQLEAMCAQTMASVANRALPLTCASADLVLIARRCTQTIWFVSGLLLVSSIVGVPALLAAAVTAAIIVLVVITIPLLGVARRAVPRLRSRAALLADLDAVSLTNQPAPLARVLLTTARNQRTVTSAWPIAPLWFDLHVADTRPGRFASILQDAMESDDGTARQRAARARRELLERARVLVDLANDSTLRADLVQIEQG